MSKKYTPLWREAHFEVKMSKTLRVRTTFGSRDVEKVHAVVAGSTFPSQNIKKHEEFGPFLEVQMSKKCTPLWREAHFQVKSDHFWRFRCRFAWQAQGTVHLVKSEQNVKVLWHVNYNHHYTTLRSNTLHYNYNYTFTTFYYTTLHYTTLHSIYTQLHYITLHYITLHSTTLLYIRLHYITFHYTSLHYTTLRSTTLQLQLHNYNPLHSTTLN